MVRGGADAVIVETSQDLLQVKAAVVGARRAFAETGTRLPVIAQITVELTGTMLLGHRDPGRAHRAGAARGRRRRAELRNRPVGDDRAPAHARPSRAGAHQRHAERRAAGGPRRGGALPADAGAAGRRPRLLHPRVRRRTGRRVLRDDAGAPAPGRRARPGPPGRRARARPGGGRVEPVRAGAVPSGLLAAHGRGADQHQRLEGVPRGPARRPLGRRARDGQERGARGGPRHRPVRRLRRPRRHRRHARRREPSRHRVDAAPSSWTRPSPRSSRPGSSASAGARSSTASTSRTATSPGSRFRRMATVAAEHGAALVVAVHRRGGPGPHGRAQGGRRRAAARHPRARPTACRRATSSSTP